jgi:DNA polymerase III subunit delta
MEVFEAESASADDIVNAANTMPFMSDRRLVVVRDLDRLDAAGLETLVSYAKDPAPYTCLVLVARKIAKNSRLYRAVEASGTVFEYAAPKRNEYGGEVVKLFRERGKRISPSTAEALVELAGRDLRLLDSEAAKIATYAGSAEEVTLADVRAVAAAGSTTTVFELLDAIGNRDVTGALRLLRRLLDGGEAALGIHAMVARHVRALIGARALAGRRMSPEQMAPELGMAPWQARNAARQAANYTPKELAAALVGLAAVEQEMKTSPTDAGLVIERWIVAVTSKDAAKAR